LLIPLHHLLQVRGLERHPSYGKTVDETLYRGILSTAKHIIQTEGIRGMYKGIWPSVIKAAPNAAIIFAVYERVSHYLEPFVNHSEGQRSQESRPH
jgi:solute carrier family 25 thiamine pyrophosphate transporter 19